MESMNWKNYIIELLIVIIGITVAFSLNNAASGRAEKKLEAKFIRDLKADLRLDSALLAGNIRFNERKVEILSGGIELLISDEKHQHVDSLIQILSYIGNYNFFVPESFMLVSLLQSGDIRLISSDELKKELLRLLRIYDLIERGQNNLLQALDDNYYPDLFDHLDIITMRPTDIDFFYSLKIRNSCAFTINDTNNIKSEYQSALQQIQKLLELMEEY